jgi:hypothetical protein
MSTIGRYCKAYPVEQLQEFGGWSDIYRRPEVGEQAAAGDGAATPENDYLFLQEDFTVTKGIFLDEDVVYDNVSQEWVDFCKNRLNFKVPEDVAAADEEEVSADGVRQ